MRIALPALVASMLLGTLSAAAQSGSAARDAGVPANPFASNYPSPPVETATERRPRRTVRAGRPVRR
jgi:Spy/CpxP family protein refolding chaperone